MNRSEEIAKAVEADTQIAAAWNAYYDARLPLDRLVKNLKRAEDSVKRYAARGDNDPVLAQNVTYYADKVAAIRAELKELRFAAEELNRKLYTGWTRFYLVKHIHRSTHCSSFRDTTRIGWLPNLSGQTEAEAVAEHGAILCTICFPSAPTEYTKGLEADPNNCTGTWDRSKKDGRHLYSPWVTCTCGQTVSVTSTGKLRKHKAA